MIFFFCGQREKQKKTKEKKERKRKKRKKKAKKKLNFLSLKECAVTGSVTDKKLVIPVPQHDGVAEHGINGINRDPFFGVCHSIKLNALREFFNLESGSS